jgi:hypothetical protein
MEFTTGFKQQVKELFVAELEKHLEGGASEGIEQIESTLRQMLVSIGAECLGAYLSAQAPSYPPDRVPCSCGAEAAYHSNRLAMVHSTLGDVSYQRPYYTCSTCHSGQSPLDERLGLGPGQVTTGLSVLLAIAGAETAFDHASHLIERFLLIEVSENTVRKETQRYGELQAEREQQWTRESQDAEHYRERHRTAKERPKRVYGSIDGAHVPLSGEWREMKVGCWYEVVPRKRRASPANDQAPVGETGDLRAEGISYYCDMQPASEFGELVWATGCQQGADLAEEVVFVADGAAWIWKLVSFYFPEAVQIVDWYHATAYLEALAEQAFGEGEPLRELWLEEAKGELWDGQIDHVIAACREWEAHPQAGQAAREAITYYTNNRQRLDYARFRRAGYMIGSGTVESGCKQIVTQRLKRSGARWAKAGARMTAKARAAYLSGQLDELSARRGQSLISA